MKSVILRDHEVRRLLDAGSVTVVREVRPQPERCDHADWPAVPAEGPWSRDEDGWHCSTCGNGIRLANTKSGVAGIPCPVGNEGERRWVRETWGLPHAFDTDRSPQALRAPRVHYAATAGLGGPRGLGGLICRSAAQMPRWASRAVVEIASVRVCRVLDLTLDDIEASGACVDMVRLPKPGDPKRACGRYIRPDGRPVFSSADGCFRVAWDEQRGATKYANDPWVWVASVSRVGAA